MDQVLVAFEAYGTDHGTYLIDGAGYQGDSGSWFTGTGSSFDPNVADALAAAGYLDPNDIPEDPWRYLDQANGLRIEHCNGRVGVFALSGGAEPSAEDAAWWDDNTCTRRSIDNHNHTYFKLSRPIDAVQVVPTDDELRQAAIGQAVVALESYAADHNTYTVAGAGENGTGQGWYQLDGTGDYTTSIADTLIAGGHLTGNLLLEPADGDLMVYPCADRVAVFSEADDIVTYGPDATWWTDNNCPTPASTDHTYLELSAPLDALDEPYYIVYSASATPGYKTATIRVQPQNGPIAFGYVTVDAPAAPGGDSALQSVSCDGDEAYCAIADDGVAHALAFTAEGFAEPFTMLQIELPEPMTPTVQTAMLQLEDLNDPDADLDYFFSDLGAIAGVGAIGYTGPEWTEYVGFDSTFNQSSDRCRDRDMSTWWNWPDVSLDLPASVELRTLGSGLVWQWDSVPFSEDCYEWETWSQYKNGNTIPGTTRRLYDTSSLTAYLTGGQLHPDTAELCASVSPETWVDQQNGINYWAPKFHRDGYTGPDFREACVPAPRHWGDPNCDGSIDIYDLIALLKFLFTGSGGCATEFTLDGSFNGALDRDDIALVFMCGSGVPFLPDLIEACDRFGIELEEATTSDGITIEDPADGPPVATWDIDPDATDYTVEFTVDGEPTGQPIVVAINEISFPSGVYGYVCVTVRSNGPNTTGMPRRICVDIERPAAAEVVRIDESSIEISVPGTTGQTPEVTVLIDEVSFQAQTAEAGTTLTVGLPADTTGEVCVEIRESAGGPVTQRTCLDYFTVVPDCGASDITVLVTNNSADTRDYVVSIPHPGGTFERSVNIGPDLSDTITAEGFSLTYDVSVTHNGEAIAPTQTARNGDCVTFSSECAGTITAEVTNIGDGPAVFELSVAVDGETLATEPSPQIVADAQSTISIDHLVYGFYDVTVLRNGDTVFEKDRYYLGDPDFVSGGSCSDSDVCPNGETPAQHYLVICETHREIGVSVVTAARLHQLSGIDEPIIALGGLDHDASGAIGSLNSFVEAGSIAQVTALARVAVTQSQLDDLFAQEQLALRARIAQLVESSETPICNCDPNGLTIATGAGTTGDWTVIRNMHGIAVLAFLTDSIQPDLSEATELFRRSDSNARSRRYQQLLDGLDASTGNSMNGAAAFALFTTGDDQLADELLAISPANTLPPVEPTNWVGVLHNVFDGLGFIPGFGEFFDLLNGAIYYVEGDDLNASISLGATVPIFGSVGTGSRLYRALPTNLVDEALQGSRYVDHAGRHIITGANGAFIDVAHGTFVRSGSDLVAAAAGRRLATIVDRLAPAGLDEGRRLLAARSIGVLPTSHQDQLINLINTSSADIGERIAANAAIDPLTTATLLQRAADFPGVTRELLSSPHYENAVLALNGSTTRAAGMTDNVLDGLDADQYGATEATRIASIIFGDQGSRQLLEIAADRPDLAPDIYRLIDDPDTGELFAAALGSTNPEWADDVVFGATEAATPTQRYEFFQQVTTQGTTGLPQWLIDVRAGRQFNTDRNLDYVNLFGNGRDGGEYLSELYLLKKPPATGYVRLDGYVPEGVWLDEFPGGAIISRKHTQYASRADPIAAGRADITELRNKYGSGSTIADVPSTPDGLANGQIEGTLILEIPPQTAPLDQAILDWAEESTDPVTGDIIDRVVIRDTNGLIYNPVSE